MAKEAGGDRPVGTLYWQLRLLARDRGIWRSNLGELLNDDLGDLLDYWEIDASQPARAIWQQVGRKLLGHMRQTQLPTVRGTRRQERQQQRFEQVFGYVFNVLNADAGLLDVRLTKAGVSKSTAQRGLRFACAEIEKQILATGFVPRMPVPDVPDDASGAEPPVKPRKIHKPEIVARELVPLSSRAATVRRVRVPYRQTVAPVPSRPGRRLSAVAAVLLLASIVGGLSWWRPWVTTVSGAAVEGTLPTSSASPSSTSSVQPSSIASQPSSPAPVVSPIRIDSVREIQAMNQGFTYVFSNKRQFSDSEIAGLNRLDVDPDKYRQWFESRGGVVSAVSAVQIVVRGAAAATVNIVDMKVIKRCTPYLKGTLFYSPPAGQDDTIYIGFDLSKQSPIAQNLQKGNLSGAYFQEHTLSLKPGETQTLLIQAFPGVQYCKLHYELAVSTGEANIQVVIDNKGKDFEVTAVPEFDYKVRFSDYPIVYAGGVANPQHTEGYVQVDPATYQGY